MAGTLSRPERFPMFVILDPRSGSRIQGFLFSSYKLKTDNPGSSALRGKDDEQGFVKT
jgi:hypothetical protein